MAVSEMLETKIAQLYVGLIGRAPDRDGLEFWARGYNSDLDKGQNADAALRGVAQRMFDSDGARDYYPEGLSDQQIVEQFYENVLGRQGDAEGIAYWTDALAKSGTDTGDVLVSMIDAVTGYSGDDPAGVTSKQLFENKAAVADYYVDNVSQAGDAADITGATALLDSVREDTDTTSENALESFVSGNYTTLTDAVVLEEKSEDIFSFYEPEYTRIASNDSPVTQEKSFSLTQIPTPTAYNIETYRLTSNNGAWEITDVSFEILQAPLTVEPFVSGEFQGLSAGDVINQDQSAEFDLAVSPTGGQSITAEASVSVLGPNDTEVEILGLTLSYSASGNVLDATA